MKRLLATISWDIRLQFRNGFYYATLFVAAVWILLFRQLLAGQLAASNLARLLPALLLNNLIINTFFFIGGLVLLEKGEGTLEAQVVTPLRTGEYLAAKVITLTLLSLLENGLIIGLTYGFRFNAPALAAGLTLAAALYCLAGFVVVARYDSINEYLLPSILYTGLLMVPVLPYFGLLDESWLFYLHPLQAPLVLLVAAFRPVPAWQWLYGTLYGGLWLALAYAACRRAFSRFVVAKAGVR